MELNGKIFHKFAATREVSGALVAGGMLVVGRSSIGCEATVGLEGGKVTTVEIRRLGRTRV